MLHAGRHLPHYVIVLCRSENIPRQVQDKAEIAQDRPKMAKDRPKIAQDRPKMVQDRSKTCPRCLQERPGIDPRGADRVESSIEQDKTYNHDTANPVSAFPSARGPSWGYLGPSWGHLGRILGILSHLMAILAPSCARRVPKEAWANVPRNF